MTTPMSRTASRRTVKLSTPLTVSMSACSQEFFLIYTGNPKTRDELKENIRREITRIPAVMLTLVADNFNVCFVAVLQQRRAWIDTDLSNLYSNLSGVVWTRPIMIFTRRLYGKRVVPL